MSNHDNIRDVSRFGSSEHLAGDDRALAKVLLAALLTIRGGACVYQGEELGLTEAEIDFSDLQDPFGIVDQQEKDPDSVLHMFRRLVAWRKGQPALIRGAIRLLPSDGTILAFERSLDRDCILCFFNFSNHEVR